ncbi:hypothetical protein TREMEDRAFT_68071 [Tremella mesenterica DSM 1558]|uniref:uncharacterized protein n=1 Tax=Tremella mesenterica (strain ATCC 24925 / CBS 8224 / DSM 1558 / NBRC 9311 / NRRL Y-6157 / RJB 2259-6 / UBC 559-6) TaxID=578456 RepID=UPI0003F497A2|nr:uncharacterized protein TREMEDRAFT_68071 [Tremella mesenterica DSM 1558]EIW70459.1 hypothetical protein TREMEDRAFT_68071 [Tremella mesenterica DSM 1558]
MSRARRSAGSVRGPSSALTSFLANLGVEPSAQLTTWGNTSAINATDHAPADGPEIMDGIDPAGSVTARNVVAGPSRVGEGTPSDHEDEVAPPRKRLRGASVDSNDLDADFEPKSGPAAASSSKPAVAPTDLANIGEFMNCGECGKRFTVTAYTKEHPNQPMTWLCVDCCYAVGVDPFAKPKKAAARKKAGGKEDRGKVVHYETRKGATPLGDICIGIIGRFIEDVEQLGDIGSINLDKVCRIISKSRRLAPETAALFYSADRQELSMYDCTNLVQDSYISMAKLCPNMEYLYLNLCGQLTTDSLISWSRTFKRLRRIELFAPFLVRKEGWLPFIKSMGKRLEGFLITQSPRIDLEVVEKLVACCPNLTELRLCEIGQMNSDFLRPLGKLRHLTLLDLSAPGTTLSDQSVIELLEDIGNNLHTLNLSDNPGLTNEIVPAIATCSNLRRLYLKHLVELTDDGVAQFFRTSVSPGFETIDLEKGHELGDGALRALIAHSGHSIEQLNLLGWRKCPADALAELRSCKHLRELNLGWCRNVTDFTLKDILEGCNEIEQIRVWGCNLLSDAVPRKKGVKVIGIETHAI